MQSQSIFALAKIKKRGKPFRLHRDSPHQGFQTSEDGATTLASHMHLSSWAKIVLEQYGGLFFFGELTLNNLPDVQAMLSGFWDKYEKAEGQQNTEKCS